MRWLALASMAGALLLLACQEERTPVLAPVPPVTPTPAATAREVVTPMPAYSPTWSVQVVKVGSQFQAKVSDGRGDLVLATSPLDPRATAELWELTATADVDGDGQEEAIVLHYTGGAHCCFEYFVVDTGPQGPIVLDSFSLGNGPIDKVMDITADGRAELLTWDDRLAYFGDLSFAHSPFLPLVLCWQEGAFRDCTTRFPDLLWEEAQRAMSALSAAMQEGGKDDAVKRGRALKVAALYYRMGRWQEGLRKVSDVCPPCADWLESYRQALMDTLSREVPYRVR
jgi:hypothetical protein